MRPLKYQILKPCMQQLFNKNIYGFDIETADDNKTFVCASIWSRNFNKSFEDKQELLDFLKSYRFKNAYIAASNMSFDFFGALHGTPELEQFKFLWRGSNLITAKTCITKEGFRHPSKVKNRKEYITFIDTMNYAALSVKNLGRLIGEQKLKTPSFLGNPPKNDDERSELLAYNLQDSKVSCLALEFLFNAFQELGSSVKSTIASTALNLWRCKYQAQDYFTHDINILREQFKGYYGGRCEAFSRGEIENYNYYDFNSLYPSVMLNELPNPNSMRHSRRNTMRYIYQHEGLSYVDVYQPDTEYPLLPLRTPEKLIFPCGNFSGWHTHAELRKFEELGGTIKYVHKTYYYKETCRPFYNYVTELYAMRKQYKAAGNPMQKVVKLLLNAIYGKFGQKFDGRDEWQPFNNFTYAQLNKLPYFERIGDFIRLRREPWPAAFCIPIWASYITSYARLKLHEYILRLQPVYVDTDSLLTKKTIHTSDELGKLKLECKIKRGIIIKPKFYMVEKEHSSEQKIKGVGVKITPSMFQEIVNTGEVSYTKFCRFKEAMRRGFIPNEIIPITKHLNIEDNKRLWPGPYTGEYQASRALNQVEINNFFKHESMRKVYAGHLRVGL